MNGRTDKTSFIDEILKFVERRLYTFPVQNREQNTAAAKKKA